MRSRPARLAAPLLPLAAAFLAGAAHLFPQDPAAGDDQEVVKDPVCGMSIKKADAFGMQVYQGTEFYFCMEGCLTDFKGEPTKYTGWVATSKKAHGYFVNLFTKPGKVTAGEYARLFLELAPEKESTWKPTAIKGSMVLNYQQGGKPQKAPFKDFEMKPMKEAGFYGTRQAFLNDGYCDAKFTIQFDDGTEEQVPFRFDVYETWDKSTGTEYGAAGSMKMAVQHHVVRKMGNYWGELEDQFQSASPDWARITDLVGRVDNYQKYLPKFIPHKHTKETDEWKRLVDEFGGGLTELTKAVAAKDLPGARKLRDRIESDNCTKCHMKFRWNTHDDVSKWPDLRGKISGEASGS